MEPDESVFQKIQDTGGWPAGRPFLSFYHTTDSDRMCEFTTQRLRTEWWTTFLVEDDYLWWRISKSRKAQIRREIIQEFKLKIAGLA
jgi:hypothetical protein